MFTFHTKSTITRETEKAWGVKPKGYDTIVWLPKSQCVIKTDARPNEEEILRAKYTFKLLEKFGELDEEMTEVVEDMVEYDIAHLPLIIEIPDWLVQRNGLYELFCE